MVTKRRRILLVILVLLLGFGAWYQFGSHDAPAGQAPLRALAGASLDPLAEDFNHASSQVRIVLLLSPT